eukprot:scaffold329444_cov16-Prasinocladus_malaysianus.AAC.1
MAGLRDDGINQQPLEDSEWSETSLFSTMSDTTFAAADMVVAISLGYDGARLSDTSCVRGRKHLLANSTIIILPLPVSSKGSAGDACRSS